MTTPDKPKRGRPLMGDAPIDTRVEFRAPKSDVAAWQAKAKAAGLKLSAWIRDRLNRQRK